MPLRFFPPGAPMELSQEPDTPLFSYVQQGSTSVSAPGLMIGPSYTSFWKDWVGHFASSSTPVHVPVEEVAPIQLEIPLVVDQLRIAEVEALQARLTIVEVTLARLLNTRWARFIMWGRRVWRVIVSNFILDK